MNERGVWREMPIVVGPSLGLGVWKGGGGIKVCVVVNSVSGSLHPLAYVSSGIRVKCNGTCGARTYTSGYNNAR